MGVKEPGGKIDVNELFISTTRGERNCAASGRQSDGHDNTAKQSRVLVEKKLYDPS
jgi:hypothetical protein